MHGALCPHSHTPEVAAEGTVTTRASRRRTAAPWPPCRPRKGGPFWGSGGSLPFSARFVSFLPPAYQITHRLNATTASTATVEVLAPSARQYTATGLKPESVYLFRITAQTRKGWGEAAEALVVTTEKRGDYPWGWGGLRAAAGAPLPNPVFRSSPRGRLGSAP